MRKSRKWKIAQELEKRWWKRYLRTKDVDAYLDWKRSYWKRFLKPLSSHLDLSSVSNILDAGCGPAGIFIILGGHNLTALDPLLDHYEEELPHFDRDAYPSMRFISSPLESFRPDHTFDLVFCLNAINHVSDLERAMRTLFDSTAPGGKLILSIDCHRFSALKALFRWIPGDALHPHQDSLQDYRTMIQKMGGEIVLTHKEKPGRIFDYYVLVIEKREAVQSKFRT